MTEFQNIEGVKVQPATLTENQKLATKNAETIAAAICAKLSKLGHPGTSKVIMIDAPEYCFFQTTFYTQDRKEKYQTEVAYSEMYYAEATTQEELLKRAKRIMKDVFTIMGIEEPTNA